MDQNSDEPIRHQVVVPLGGVTVADAQAMASAHGIDPESPEARLFTAFQAEPEWEAVVTFEVGATGAHATALEVRSTRGQPLSRAVWDRVRPAEVIREAAAQTEWLVDVIGKEPVRPRRRPGGAGRPPEYTEEHYAAVGRVYSAAIAAGKPPVRAVARAFEGKPHPTTGRPLTGLLGTEDKRARAWVRQARSRGYISDAPPPDGGRA